MKKRLLRVLSVCAALLALTAGPLSARAASDARVSGDLDGDGYVCPADAAAVLRAADGTVPLDAQTGVLADTTGDQTVGRTDALAILLLSVGKLKSFTDLVLPGGAPLLGDRHLDRFSYLGVVRMVNGYLSRLVSVRVSTFTCEGAVCYLADVYLQRVESLRTAFGGGRYGGGRETVQEIAARTGALLTVNGDEYARIHGGPLVRNGEWYRDSVQSASDVCVLYKNGVMETVLRSDVDVSRLKESDVYHTWVGGQPLLDAEGKARTRFGCSDTLLAPSARTAIGYFEPGHYCLLTVDGTQNAASAGLSLSALAGVFERLGCQSAFNLYGDTYALMCLGTEPYSTPYIRERLVSDAICICEPEE